MECVERRCGATLVTASKCLLCLGTWSTCCKILASTSKTDPAHFRSHSHKGLLPCVCMQVVSGYRASGDHGCDMSSKSCSYTGVGVGFWSWSWRRVLLSELSHTSHFGAVELVGENRYRSRSSRVVLCLYISTPTTV